MDIGTTSAKAVAFTVDGVARASGRAGYELYNPHPGWAEQDPEAVLAATLEATAEAVRGAREARLEVQGLAFGAAMHSLIALDASTTAISRVLTWADARAAEQAARLRNDSRGLALHRRTGTPIHPMSPLVKLRWYRENEPELAARAQHWVGVKELVLQRLTGALVVDHGIASGMGMFNLRDEAWDSDALGYAGVVPEQLARLVATTEVLRLNAEGARAVGLPVGTPLVAGSSDGPLANLGLGAIRPGAVACSIAISRSLAIRSGDTCSRDIATGRAAATCMPRLRTTSSEASPLSCTSTAISDAGAPSTAISRSHSAATAWACARSERQRQKRTEPPAEPFRRLGIRSPPCSTTAEAASRIRRPER
ncbi:MAG: hypothetical protein KY463_14225 [Actinobacteria bacterium]|nr:hypothetical protein [Actinomycetota bacterium]